MGLETGFRPTLIWIS